MNIDIPASPLPTPADHAAWLEERRHGIGSSDASAVVGMSDYASPYTVWEEKTGKAPIDVFTDDQRERMNWGNLLEPVIREETARRLGIEIAKPDHAHHHPDRPWQRCNLDGWTSERGIAEFKTTSAMLAWAWDDQVPDHPLIQVHHSALITGADHAIIAALIGGQKLVIQRVEISQNILDMLMEAEDEFWHKYVERDVPPPIDGHVATMESIMREWAHKPGAIEVAHDDAFLHWQQYQEAHEDEKDAKRRKNDARAALAALMDGHEQLTTGTRVWAAAQRGQLNEKLLQADDPELYEQFVVPTPTFDRAAFKAAHPEKFTQYQHTSIRPKGAPKEK